MPYSQLVENLDRRISPTEQETINQWLGTLTQFHSPALDDEFCISIECMKLRLGEPHVVN